jgi:hypothetical protein
MGTPMPVGTGVFKLVHRVDYDAQKAKHQLPAQVCVPVSGQREGSIISH